MTFKLNGADLKEEKEIRRIEIEITKLNDKFNSNCLDSTNAFELYIKVEKELDGLPESSLNQASEAAEKKGHKGEYLFTIHVPSYFPVIKYAKSDAFRKKMWEVFGTIGHTGEFENGPILLEICRLRDKKASILGFSSFADLILAQRMALKGGIALHFFDN